MSKSPASLESPINEEDGSTLGDIVADPNATSPSESLQSKSLRGDIDHVLSTLEPREADIIRLRFGLEGRDPLTLEEVGVKIGVTRERVRQLQEQAIRNIRQNMKRYEKQRTKDEIAEELKIAERKKILAKLLGNTR